MKNIFFILAILVSLLACEKSSDTPSIDSNPDTVSLSMGAGYANDIYYSLDSGEVAIVARANWDIAFHTNAFSSTILTNGGSGVELYQHAQDTSNWSTIDTVGIKSWTKLYNSDTTWTMGAFERNATVHPDYGWCEYNSESHDLIGNKVFIIKLATTTNSYKKIWIKKKLSSQNKFILQYANLDNSNLQTITVNCQPYISKNFVYFSLSSNAIVDREPAAAEWDFVITKYRVPNVPETVTGILTNTMRISNMGVVSYFGVTSAKVSGVNVTSNDFSSANFSTSISAIGWDWKTFSMATNKYSIEPNLVYYIKKSNKISKIQFLSFAGSTSGNLEFVTKKVK